MKPTLCETPDGVSLTGHKGTALMVPFDLKLMTFEEARIFDEEYAKGFPLMLIAEDDVLLRNILLRILQPLSFAVLVATDGLEAITLSRSLDDEIALLITDMEMPRMGGN